MISRDLFLAAPYLMHAAVSSKPKISARLKRKDVLRIWRAAIDRSARTSYLAGRDDRRTMRPRFGTCLPSSQGNIVQLCCCKVDALHFSSASPPRSQMLALTDSALARLAIAATRVDPRERGRWLQIIAAKLEALCTEEISSADEDDRTPEARRKALERERQDNDLLF